MRGGFNLVVVGLMTSSVLSLSYLWLNQPRDLAVYLSATRALMDHRSAWDAATISAIGHTYGYLPPDINASGLWTLPTVLPLLVPFTLLSFPLAAWLWTALNILLFQVELHLMAAWLPALTPRRRAGLMIMYPPALALLLWGQVVGVVLFGYVLFVTLTERRRDGLAGMCLALSTFKPHLGFLAWIWIGWWIVKHRRWKIILGTAIGLLIDIGLVFILNPNWLGDYRAAVAALPLSYDASTVWRVIYRLFLPDAPWIQFAGVAISIVILVVYLARQRSDMRLLPAVPVLMLCSVICAPYGWIYDQLIALPAFLWIANDLFERSPAWWVWGLLLIPAVLYYLQSGTHWGDNNPLLFWLPLLVAIMWVINSRRRAALPRDLSTE
jgi:hypothetical protein